MTKEFQTDVCVVGAGPGGVVAAMAMAKEGIKSLVVDKAKFPRDKICGDAISGKVVEVLNKINPSIVSKLNAEPTQVGSWGVKFIAPNLKELRVPFKNGSNANQPPPGYVCKRLDFDHFLIRELALYKEVQFLESTEIGDYEFKGGYWILSSRDRSIRIKARLVIVASGAQSKFSRHHASIKMEPKHYCAGVRAYYKNVSGLDHNNFIELFFLKELLPGYLWIFPLPNGLANVGLGVRSDKVSAKKMNLKKELEQILRSYPQLHKRFNGAERLGEIKGFGLPLGTKKRRISGDGFMLAGDAASLIDPFTGEGIGNAMMSGMFAAKQAVACMSSNDFSTFFMQQYDNNVYGRLWKELSLSRRMQQLVTIPWLFNFVVNKASTNKTLQETISCMFEDLDLRKRLKQPSFYLNLLFPN